MNQDMSETMNEIDSAAGSSVIVNKRQSLQSDIENLKKNIQNARETVGNSNLNTTLHASISPERANESKRTLVFLERDLEAKQSEFDELDK